VKSLSHKLCGVESCNKPTYGKKGYCRNHYKRLLKYGYANEPYKYMREHPETCTIDGCDRKWYCKGYCEVHYGYLMRNGDPLTTYLHGMAKKREYFSWQDMKSRCYNPNTKYYEYYGGRGIKVCERWRNNFVEFYEDLGDRPEGMSLDRKDSNGNYSCGKCPECLTNGWVANCQWATRKHQSVNTRMHRTNTSGRRGVSWDKRSHKWEAYISIDNSKFSIGHFSDREEAAWMRDQWALALYGPDAPLNFEYVAC
jgi:hypothetical protein